MGSALVRPWGVMKAKVDASGEENQEYVNTDMLDPFSGYFGLLLHAVLSW